MLDLDDGFINQMENNNANYNDGSFSLNATDTISIGQNEEAIVLTYISSSDLNSLEIPIQPAIPIMKIYDYPIIKEIYSYPINIPITITQYIDCLILREYP